MKLISFVIISIFFLPVSIQAQQQTQFTQYMFNGLILNPAYAGIEGALSLTFYNRMQWVGLEGAPVTQTLSGHTAFKNDRVGIGLSILNDKIGVHRNFVMTGSSAYHIKISDVSSFSFGLQFGFDSKKSDYTSVVGNVPIDPKLDQSNYSKVFLNLGAGIYYKSPKINLGFSVPDLLPGNLNINDSTSIRFKNIHYYLFSKYRYKLNTDFVLEPGFLLKYLAGISLSYDVNANVIIREVLTVGLSYRRKESLDLLVKMQVTPQLQLGYGYDHTIGSVSKIAASSHELMINYLFKYSKENIPSPR